MIRDATIIPLFHLKNRNCSLYPVNFADVSEL